MATVKWTQYLHADEARRLAEIKAEQSALSTERRRIRKRASKRMERGNDPATVALG